MSTNSPQTLEYNRRDPRERSSLNIPAILSIAMAITGLVFMFSVFAGVWRGIVPGINSLAGWIVLGLSISSVICGGIGALRADRESAWYSAALVGYAGGMFMGTLSPMLFMI